MLKKVYIVAWGETLNPHGSVFSTKEKAEAEMQKMIQDHKNMVQEQNEFNEEFCSIYRMRDTSHLIKIVEINTK